MNKPFTDQNGELWNVDFTEIAVGIPGYGEMQNPRRLLNFLRLSDQSLRITPVRGVDDPSCVTDERLIEHPGFAIAPITQIINHQS